MPQAPANGEIERAVEEQFVDLIYGDADLLAAEFDAIIAAAWPEPPREIPSRGDGGHPGGGPARRAGDPVRGPVSRPWHPGVGALARQRSPPVPTPDARQAGR